MRNYRHNGDNILNSCVMKNFPTIPTLLYDYSFNFDENISRGSSRNHATVEVIVPVAGGLGPRPRHRPDRRLTHRPAIPQGATAVIFARFSALGEKTAGAISWLGGT